MQPDRDFDASALTAWLRAMPKAELHLHIDGSLRPDTALDLARQQGHSAASGMDVAAMRERLVAPERCVDQAQLLEAFDLPVSLLQDRASLQRVTAELVEDVAGDGTRYAELRWAPSLHLEGDLALREGMDAVAQAAAAAADARGIHVRLIAVALRTHPADVATEVAHEAVRLRAKGLTGFDLAGREQEAPDPMVFADAFEVARQGGLGITCHAAEWGGPAQVRRALRLRPWRIAHGAPAADDSGLMRELIESGVTLDICPTSNTQAGIGTWDPAAPLPRLVRAGVPVTINTDDRTVSDLTLVRELCRAVKRLGLHPAEILGAVRQAYTAAFLHHDEALRSELLGAFDGWAAAHPEPGQPSVTAGPGADAGA